LSKNNAFDFSSPRSCHFQNSTLIFPNLPPYFWLYVPRCPAPLRLDIMTGSDAGRSL
jgi:hypothetical protein